MISPCLVFVVQIVHLLLREETGGGMRWMWGVGGERGGGGGHNQITASRKQGSRRVVCNHMNT